jgi:hypothetical protein
MTLTSLITINAVLGAALAYALHHLLAHGIRTSRAIDHAHAHAVAVVARPEREAERIAA